MKTYDCEVLMQGQTYHEVYQAHDEDSLRRRLRREGIILVRAKARHTRQAKGFSLEACGLFLHAWSSLLAGGMPLAASLQLLAKTEQGKEKALCTYFSEGLLDGQRLSVLWRRQATLPTTVADWLALGETQGQLAETMAWAATECLERHQARKKLLEQLFYPCLLLLMVLLVALLFALLVLPTMAHTLMTIEAPLPAFLQWPMAVAAAWHRLPTAVPILLILIFFAVPGFQLYQKRVIWRCFPWPRRIREFWQWQTYADFALFLGRLLTAGMPLPDALAMIAQQDRFRYAAKELKDTQEALYQGKPFIEAMERMNLVPPLALSLLATAQVAGRVPETLMESGDFFRQKSEVRLSWLQRLIEPIAIGILGVMILGLALSFFLPLLATYNGIFQ